jgi:DNA mismatch endonuclease, patch repair protein
MAAPTTDPATSARMRRVRRTDTAPELKLRQWLAAQGYRYRLHNRRLPGTPDISNSSKRWAIFVHGCFWHGHEGCSKATVPKRNADFWRDKIEANRARDRRKAESLRSLGFAVYEVWECQLEELGEAQAPRLSLPPRPHQARPDRPPVQ